MYIPKNYTTHNGQGGFVNPMDDELIRGEITVYGEINSELAAEVCSALRVMARDNDEITIRIHSPGGSITAGFYIYDTINLLKKECVKVRVIACGDCKSMAAFLLAAGGTKGMRGVMENTEILIHQPLGGVQGQASDIQNHANHILRLRSKLNRILSEVTGQSIKTIEKDTDRDTFMTAEEAVKYGLADYVC